MLCLFEKTKRSKNTRKIKAFLVLFLAIMIVSFCAISSGASNVGIEGYYEYDAETGEETIFSLPAASTYARSSNETIEWDENGNIISRSTPPYDPNAAEGVSMKIASKIAPLAKTSNADDYTKVTNTRAFPYKCIGYIVVVKGYDSNGNEKKDLRFGFIARPRVVAYGGAFVPFY